MFHRKRLILSFFIFSFSHSMGNASIWSFLQDNVPDYRRITFQYALHLMGMRNVRTIVETGTMRGEGWQAYTYDGGFTHIFGIWCSCNNAHLYSVDINEQVVKTARSIIKKENIAAYVTIVHEDSVSFLKEFNKPIDVLYLDSFDFDKENPLPSQIHHLHEIEAAYDKLTDESIVMIDDCGLEHGGKGKLVIPFLEERGWHCIIKEYQVILIK